MQCSSSSSSSSSSNDALLVVVVVILVLLVLTISFYLSKLQDSHAQRAKEHEAASKRITQLKKSVSDSKKISADMADMRARLGIQNRLANQKIAEVIDLLTSKARESQVLGSFEINLLIHLLQNGKGLMSLLAEEQKDKG